MSEKQIKIYMELLAGKMVQQYGLHLQDVKVAIALSAIQTLIREEPEYVDTMPLSYWADAVYKEMLRKGGRMA